MRPFPGGSNISQSGFCVRARAICTNQPLESSHGTAVGPALSPKPAMVTPGQTLPVAASTGPGASHGMRARSPHGMIGKSVWPLKSCIATAARPAARAAAIAAA